MKRFEVDIRTPQGTVLTWTRFAPHAEALLEQVRTILGKEWPAGGASVVEYRQLADFSSRIAPPTLFSLRHPEQRTWPMVIERHGEPVIIIPQPIGSDGDDALAAQRRVIAFSTVAYLNTPRMPTN